MTGERVPIDPEEGPLDLAAFYRIDGFLRFSLSRFLLAHHIPPLARYGSLMFSSWAMSRISFSSILLYVLLASSL